MASAGALIRERLARLAALEDEAVGLGETALAIAALDRPRASEDDYQAYLAELAGELAEAGGGLDDAESRAGALSEVMARRHRYRGDDRDDDDLANANLMTVIDTRRGVAEALGILYLDAARRAGWTAHGLSFPAHFLLRIEDGRGRRVIIDPFAGGAPVDPPTMRALLKAGSGMGAELEPSLYSPLPNRDILIRLQNDVKLRLLRCGRIDRAVEVVEAVLLFAPDRAVLWREAGLMRMRLDDLPRAVAALEQFVGRTTNPQARRRTLQLLQELKGRMH